MYTERIMLYKILTKINILVIPYLKNVGFPFDAYDQYIG